ncbi:serine/threonine-protein kinase (plasmid) [Sorangium sp. So ce119]|uniref:serine/threonine-protein kinase n=1 Tax=Sorangium sp. So ce119 TaxID=3133279 RepID=UPI003F5D7A31
MDSPYGLHAGSIIGGDFEVVRPLGSGGMGSVYLCRQRSTARQRAVKVMHPMRAGDPEQRRRFEQEALAPGLIGSPHIVDVLIAGVDPASSLPYLAMELLHGETLSACVARRGPLPIAEARRVLDQLGRALEAAHNAGIVHRDLKPENVFLEDAGDGAPPRVKLLDFGIAKIIDQARDSMTGAVGTPLWMAPEQAGMSPAALPQSDVWAYGLLAFFVLTGEVFWEGRGLPALLREIVLDPIPAASRRAADLGLPPLLAGFDAWFARCVARDPFARFTSASTMWPALERLLDTAALAPPAGPPAPGAAEARRRSGPPQPGASFGGTGAEQTPPPSHAHSKTVTVSCFQGDDDRAAADAAPLAGAAAGAHPLDGAGRPAAQDDTRAVDRRPGDPERARPESAYPAPPASAALYRGQGNSGATEPILHAVDDDHCVATWKGVLFQIWHRHTTPAAVRGVRSVLREHGGGLQATLVILEENMIPVGKEARLSLAELSRELAAHGMYAALVFEGHGFKASLVRNVAIEFILLSRSRLRYEVFSTVNDAVAWMMRNSPKRDWLRELPGVTEALRRATAPDATQAVSASSR